ncbi:Zinc finger fyve domain-containing protein 26 [Plakobranchus ocellatus]|uniref:Zinc finger fyve domain-containing protein 26 n=1 Tax=Plakobranchus ocellatus TaxID=259542 RepID=A0AAV4C339_9GAST|nr:Zinc finger fyve domain-containing protein 26 [Plakobranchus ocellatus]
MEVCITQALGGAASDSHTSLISKSQVPTLFGQSSDRTQLVGMVLLSGSDFSAGFDLTVRIIKEFRLNPVLIFTHCSRELAKLGRFSEISTLIQRLVQEELVDDDGVDEIVGASLLVIADSHNQVNHAGAYGFITQVTIRKIVPRFSIL